MALLRQCLRQLRLKNQEWDVAIGVCLEANPRRCDDAPLERPARPQDMLRTQPRREAGPSLRGAQGGRAGEGTKMHRTGPHPGPDSRGDRP